MPTRQTHRAVGTKQNNSFSGNINFRRQWSTLDVFIEKGKKIGWTEGRNDGLAEGLERQKQKTEKVIRNLLQVSMLTDEQIASIAEVTVEYVAQIRTDVLKTK